MMDEGLGDGRMVLLLGARVADCGVRNYARVPARQRIKEWGFEGVGGPPAVYLQARYLFLRTHEQTVSFAE